MLLQNRNRRAHPSRARFLPSRLREAAPFLPSRLREGPGEGPLSQPDGPLPGFARRLRRRASGPLTRPLPASGERGNAGSSFLCPPPPPALAERRKTRAPEDPLPPGEGRVRGRFRLRKRRAKPRQPPVAPREPPPGLPRKRGRGNAGSSFLCPPPPPALAERRKTRAPEDPLLPGEGRVRGRFRLRKRRAKPRQPPVAPREPPPGLPRKRGRRRKEQARGKEQGRQTHRTQADMRCANPVGGGLALQRAKKSGPPEGGPPVSPGEGTDQKPSVMPVTKPVPSFLPPVTFLWPVVSSTPKTELFHATPGASV